MLQEIMEALIDIVDWYASPLGTFIRKFSMDKLVMQEVAYHISIRLSATLHRKKKAPWPALPLQIGLYEIQSLKHIEAETKEFNRFTFGSRSFNTYDPHCVV